ncbi:hypothetical protein PV327_010730 [Microctonus hyperodae]|uniref:N-acetyltransferase domain-containing protein n=1 Tax=Microctonus hyperodae TaxID=165561 RepID=A0AA39C838_MICHY|nr:hypothetical protein PV327_010730 [Microctonus hyperodae]
MECPEPVARGRNFRLLIESELPRLLDFLGEYLPESLKFHQTVLTYMKDRVWEFHFYVADEWPTVPICLHFPGMTLSPHGLLYESFGVFCPTDNLQHLQLLRDEDILIDWEKPLYINFVHCTIADELFRLYNGIGTIERVLGDVWACDKPDKTLKDIGNNENDGCIGDNGDGDNVDSNSDVQVLPLCAEHAEGIHELYPANDMECHEIFLRLIKCLPAAGVFVKGQLAAWMIQSYYGAMFSMQTKPEYRRKGYGTRLARFLYKVIVKRGYVPFVVILPQNEASRSLYRKLGFRKLYQTVRAILMPHGWQEIANEDNNDETMTVIRENLENDVKQLRVEQRVIEDSMESQHDTTNNEDVDDDDDGIIQDEIKSSMDNDDEDQVAENGFVKDYDDEQLENRIENLEIKHNDNNEGRTLNNNE